jgi:organic radical activating enzyme
MFTEGPVKTYDECTAEEWIEFFDNIYPEWISYVCISGGEPSFHKGMHKIVNYLVARGTDVRIYSNLANVSEILMCKPSPRLNVWATFHPSDNKDIFVRHVQDVKLQHIHISVNEIQEPRQLPDSIYKGLYTAQDIRNFNVLHFAPDTPRTRRVYCGCTPVYTRDQLLDAMIEKRDK